MKVRRDICFFKASGSHEDFTRKEKKKSSFSYDHPQLHSYIFWLCGWNFFPQYFANTDRFRTQLWKENLVHWIFLVRKCYLISKGGEREFLVSTTDNLIISNVCLYASLPSPYAHFFPSLLSKTYVPSKILFIIIILEGLSYENWSSGSWQLHVSVCIWVRKN